MTEESSAAYPGPLSPEELAECDRELEEDRRKFSKRLDRMIQARIDREINREINGSIYGLD